MSLLRALIGRLRSVMIFWASRLNSATLASKSFSASVGGRCLFIGTPGSSRCPQLIDPGAGALMAKPGICDGVGHLAVPPHDITFLERDMLRPRPWPYPTEPRCGSPASPRPDPG